MVKLATLRVRKAFGDELVAKGAITEEELKTVTNLLSQTHEKIGKLLVDLGALSETDLVKQLSDYLGIRYVTSEDFPAVPVLENSFSVRFMRECKFVPIGLVDDNQLVLAMADPVDQSTLDAIRLYSRFQDFEVVLAPESEILDLIEKF